jgi:hypothetical protein
MLREKDARAGLTARFVDSGDRGSSAPILFGEAALKDNCWNEIKADTIL